MKFFTPSTIRFQPSDEDQNSKPFSFLELMLAWRYIRSRHKEAFISVISYLSLIGIFVGVATLIVVMSVMNGFREELFTKILGIRGHIVIRNIEGPLENYDDIVNKLKSINELTDVIPYVERQALVSSALGKSSGTLVKGIREADLLRFSTIKNNIQDGTLENFDEDAGIAIGLGLARHLGLQVKDTITLTIPHGEVTPLGRFPRVESYPISAIFSVGFPDYDAHMIFMPLSKAQSYFGIKKAITAIDCYLKNPDLVEEALVQVGENLNKPLEVADWKHMNAMLFSVLETERKVMFLILAVIILVASLNVASGLTMLVKDKAGDIAILRTMGASKYLILRVFLIAGAIIGVTGTLLGIALGILLCWQIEIVNQFITLITGIDVADLYLVSHITAVVKIRDLLSIALTSISLSLLATLYPAWKASVLDPIEAIRRQ